MFFPVGRRIPGLAREYVQSAAHARLSILVWQSNSHMRLGRREDVRLADTYKDQFLSALDVRCLMPCEFRGERESFLVLLQAAVSNKHSLTFSPVAFFRRELLTISAMGLVV